MPPARRSFAVGGCLGRGGFGEVYRARMTTAAGVTTDVALKVLLREVGGDGQAARRMRDEGRLLARLHHPGILQVHDLVELDGRLALVTELVDGQDLAACLRGPDPIPPRALLEVVARTAEALDAAWNGTDGRDGGPLRLVHRDVKPSNLLVSRHGDVRLLDFGLARSDEVTREAHTRTDLLVGSPAYMAPERYLARTERSASDVFSLGATLFEGLTGSRLLDLPLTMAASFAVAPDRFAAHLDERFGTLDGPPAVVELVRAMLAFDPDARPSATSVATRCEDLAATLDGPSLATWCRDRDWPDVEATGAWTGRTLEEDTATLRAPAAPPTMPRGKPTPLVAAAAVGLLLTFIAVCTGVATLSWSPLPAPTEHTEPAEPAPLAGPTPNPAPPPAATPAVGAAPELAHPELATRRTHTPQPPEPEPDPTPPPPLQAHVMQGGDTADIVIEGQDGSAVSIPATVPPGRYAVRARLPNGPVNVEPFEAEPNTTYTIGCSARLHRCVVEILPPPPNEEP